MIDSTFKSKLYYDESCRFEYKLTAQF